MPKFVARQRKHKVLQRQKNQGNRRRNEYSGTNAVEILPEVAAEREKKKVEIRAGLISKQPAMSSKKKKRLDKYIVSTSSTADRAFSQCLLVGQKIEKGRKS